MIRVTYSLVSNQPTNDSVEIGPGKYAGPEQPLGDFENDGEALDAIMIKHSRIYYSYLLDDEGVKTGDWDILADYSDIKPWNKPRLSSDLGKN